MSARHVHREKFAGCLRPHFVLADHVGKQLNGGRRVWLPRKPQMPTTARNSHKKEQKSSALFLHPFDVPAAEGFEQPAGFVSRILGIGWFDHHKIAVVRGQGEAAFFKSG
jgi:hypothetical protein